MCDFTMYVIEGQLAVLENYLQFYILRKQQRWLTTMCTSEHAWHEWRMLRMVLTGDDERYYVIEEGQYLGVTITVE